MPDEAETGSAKGTDRGGHPAGSRSEPAPLQSRANFLQNWNWASVTQIHDGLCERGGAQRGVNSETYTALAKEWEKVRTSELTLLETYQFLKSCHRRSPFLFFNGNTFAEIGRALANAIFSDLPFQRRKEASSAAAHFITGVLEQATMIGVVQSLWEAASYSPGDRVRTFRGAARGVVLRIAEDGRIVWRPDGGTSELLSLPEGLLREKEQQ